MEREVQVIVTAIAGSILCAARPMTPQEAIKLAAELVKEAERVTGPSQEVRAKMAEAMEQMKAEGKIDNLDKP